MSLNHIKNRCFYASRQAMGARPGVLDLLHFCGYQLPEQQQQFDPEVLASVRSQDMLEKAEISDMRKNTKKIEVFGFGMLDEKKSLFFVIIFEETIQYYLDGLWEWAVKRQAWVAT